MVEHFSQAEELKSQPGPLRSRFEMLEKIGEGGMGAVFKARQIATDRIVAIKMLSPEFSRDEARRKRFEQEAKAAGSFFHPNLVSIHDVGSEGENAYIVMEYIPGHGLDEIIRERKNLQPHELIEIFSQICKGMSHVHAKGIVHRDLKPSNVMIVKDESGETLVKVVDFGIVKSDQSKSGSITQTGELLGSPLYMSPEQATGQQVDARSDIYSLGCMLYEAAAGRPPFVGENPVATLCMRLNQDPEPFYKVAPFACLPAALEKIVMRAMQRDPNARYQTMAAVQADLKELEREHPKPSATMQGLKTLRAQQPVSGPPINTSVRWKEIGLLAVGIVVAAGAVALMIPKPSRSPQVVAPVQSKPPVVVAQAPVKDSETEKLKQQLAEKDAEIRKAKLELREVKAAEAAEKQTQTKDLAAEKEKLLKSLQDDAAPVVRPTVAPPQIQQPAAPPKLIEILFMYGLPPEAGPHVAQAVMARYRNPMVCEQHLRAAEQICKERNAELTYANARIHHAHADVLLSLQQDKQAEAQMQIAGKLMGILGRPAPINDLWPIGPHAPRVVSLDRDIRRQEPFQKPGHLR